MANINVSLKNNLTHLPRHEYTPGIGDARARCSLDPNSNSTAIWVEKGNPDDIPALYSGTNAVYFYGDDIIYRSPLYNGTGPKPVNDYMRTVKYDSKLLYSKSQA